MAAVTRLQLFHYSFPNLKPSLLLPKCPHSPSSFSFNNNRHRKFSTSPLCSNSDSIHEVHFSLFLPLHLRVYVGELENILSSLKLNPFCAFSEFVFEVWTERVYSGWSSGLSQRVLDSVSCYGYVQRMLGFNFRILFDLLFGLVFRGLWWIHPIPEYVWVCLMRK